MSDCLTVFCLNWTGDGCACQVFGIDPVEVEHDPGCACRKCERVGRQDMRSLFRATYGDDGSVE